MAKNIIVIGKSGQVAWELAQLQTKHNLSFFGRNDIDITSPESIETTLGHLSIDAIINASAYTAVDKAEQEVEQAYAINATAVKNLVEFCKANSIHFTHISTDYVFGGDKGSPYLPDDEYDPKSVYGASKMEGEKHIRAIYPENSCIIRTSWVYSSHGNNFVKTMLRLMNERDELSVIDDQIGSPTYAGDLAKACVYASTNKVLGIHHWTDEGVCSWYDFAVCIKELASNYDLLGAKVNIKRTISSLFPTVAKRPNYSVLCKRCSKIAIERSSWRHNLELVIKSLNA